MSQSDFVTRGQGLVAQGQYQEAVKVCRLGLLGRPTTVEGRIVLGQALLALKRYDEVLAEMRVALELDHSSVPAQMLKAEALLKKGDPHAAMDVMQRLRPQASNDPKLGQMLAEAERALGRPGQASASHPSVGFVGGLGTSDGTKSYVNHGAEDEDTDDDADERTGTGDSYTKPTSISAPTAAKKKSQPVQRMAPPETSAGRTPSPAVLAVGDRSGTVEVDPDRDGVELRPSDDDFGDIAPPPPSRSQGAVDPSGRGQVIASTRDQRSKALEVAAKRPREKKVKTDISSVELMDDEIVEVPEEVTGLPRRPPPGPGTYVRNAVNVPSGPFESRAGFQAAPAAGRPTQHQAAPPPPHLAQMLANQPHVVSVGPSGPPPPPGPPRGAVAAAMPTVAAAPLPPQPVGMDGRTVQGMGPLNPAAVRPTVALTPAQQAASATVDQLFSTSNPQPQMENQMWGRQPMQQPMQPMPMQGPPMGPPMQQPMQPMPMQGPPMGMQPMQPMPMQGMYGNGPMDPSLQPMLEPSNASGIAFMPESSSGSGKAMKTGVRKRSKFQIAMWVIIGTLVIGGGVFAGFQIRAMRLRNMIGTAREDADNLAKSDTWKGWVKARDVYGRIVEASSNIEYRAALARAQALIAFEFADGIADAKAAVDALGGQGGLDGDIAAAYVALAQDDARGAKTASDNALAEAANDATCLYLAGRAALLAGDTKTAIAKLQEAMKAEPRALYAVGLAHAYILASAWDDAQKMIAEALKLSADHPGALIARAHLLVANGKIVPGAAIGSEVRSQLQKIIAEGGKPIDDQPRGVSPGDVAFAYLALTQVDYQRNDAQAVQADLKAVIAAAQQIDDQRYAEETIETLYMAGDVDRAIHLADDALKYWPNSRRSRMAKAQALLAIGKQVEALDTLSKVPEIPQNPRALAIRGSIRVAASDFDGARADFDAALNKAPNYELAVIGRTWVDLASGDVADARKRIEPRYHPDGSTVALATTYAAVLRRTGSADDRAKAQRILEKATVSAPGLDAARAQLELARVDRDLGDLRGARAAYAEAAKAGSLDAKIESGLLQIEDRDPQGGRDTFDQLIKAAGDKPPPILLLEGARARMLVGDHMGAQALLDQADKGMGDESKGLRWQLDRERGRLALRKSDYAGASTLLARALDGSGDDSDTLLLAADVAAADEKQSKLGDKVRALAPKRLGTRAEALIVRGKLTVLQETKLDEAEKAYDDARTQLDAEKASPRRLAQAHLGRAIVAFYNHKDAVAVEALGQATELDPSLYSAYLYAEEIAKDKDPKRALELARKAVQFNPDVVDAWVAAGTLAAKLNQRKLLDDAITNVNRLAPNNEGLKLLRSLQQR